MFALKFTKIKYRGYFKQWMAQGQRRVLQMSNRDKEDRATRVKEQGKLIKCVNNRVKNQMVDYRNYVILSECFQAWREEISLLKAFKVKTSMYRR